MFSRETQALTRQHRAPCDSVSRATAAQVRPTPLHKNICRPRITTADRPLSGSVGRVDPTRIWASLGCRVGRSVGSFRPKIFFAALRAAVGRSVFTESETQKSHCVGRSVDDAKITFNFAPPCESRNHCETCETTAKLAVAKPLRNLRNHCETCETTAKLA